MVAHTCHLSTGEAEPGGLTQVSELPGLHSEFRASLGLIESLKNKQKG